MSRDLQLPIFTFSLDSHDWSDVPARLFLDEVAVYCHRLEMDCRSGMCQFYLPSIHMCAKDILKKFLSFYLFVR